MTAERKVTVKRTKGRTVTVSLKLAWDSGALPEDHQFRIWEGVARLLTAVMTREEASEFMDRLRAKADEPLKERKKI